MTDTTKLRERVKSGMPGTRYTTWFPMTPDQVLAVADELDRLRAEAERGREASRVLAAYREAIRAAFASDGCQNVDGDEGLSCIDKNPDADDDWCFMCVLSDALWLADIGVTSTEEPKPCPTCDNRTRDARGAYLHAYGCKEEP